MNLALKAVFLKPRDNGSVFLEVPQVVGSPALLFLAVGALLGTVLDNHDVTLGKNVLSYGVDFLVSKVIYGEAGVHGICGYFSLALAYLPAVVFDRHLVKLDIRIELLDVLLGDLRLCHVPV